jgi:hypothetical protein
MTDIKNGTQLFLEDLHAEFQENVCKNVHTTCGKVSLWTSVNQALLWINMAHIELGL